MDAASLKQRVEEISWYHRIELPHGIVTPGVYDPREMLTRIKLPNLEGRTVLDIGAWDGFWSFEAKKRNASLVLATDSYSWTGEGWGDKRGFLLAREALGLDVEDLEIDVMSLSPNEVGRFDVVFFLGVLYHLRDPIGALEKVASVTSDMLILETESSLSWLPMPAAAVFPGTELNEDPTNWWSFNERAIVALLRSVGFRRVERVWRPDALHRGVRSLRQLYKSKRYTSSRIVFHAWK
ncbi:tRNA (mo5U34)-methyltransferase [Ferrithrix thermotolerans DSM 19514]|uniref:tRNA (Mo5U34)-methyltransferase n=1 Tax=Ferrithrix thermotolerans DSM 19514 TaxID=1121881 RepID=A0A1M4X707_9ACTN|nr:DUF1698 domain-containing protein [Ferrithrix thermotolerans]SHE89163.1 tRNA (mo5U34)-methyltransferase [Ferrithrix thermotolerans DSM 19514]